MNDTAAFMDPSFLKCFIEAYKKYPCLWKVESDDFSYIAKREEALNTLLVITRKVIPAADLEFLRARIENLKESVQKEIGRARGSPKSGVPEDNVNKPRLWYYELLSFMTDQEDCSSSTLSLTGANKSQIIEAENTDTQVLEPSIEEKVNRDGKRSKPCEDVWRQQLYGKTFSVLEKPDDDFDLIGSVIAAKLRKMDDDQFTKADKLINDALYKGLQKQMSTNSDTSRKSLSVESTGPKNSKRKYHSSTYVDSSTFQSIDSS